MQQDLFTKGLYEITETKRFDLTTKGQLAEQELFDCCLFSSKKHPNMLYGASQHELLLIWTYTLHSLNQHAQTCSW